MSIEKVIRAWKDADYRESLSEAERALLPQHPAGLVNLADSDLDAAAGGLRTISYCEFSCSETFPIECSMVGPLATRCC